LDEYLRQREREGEEFGTRSKVGPKSRRSVKDSAVGKQNSYRAALEIPHDRVVGG